MTLWEIFNFEIAGTKTWCKKLILVTELWDTTFEPLYNLFVLFLDDLNLPSKSLVIKLCLVLIKCPLDISDLLLNLALDWLEWEETPSSSWNNDDKIIR